MPRFTRNKAASPRHSRNVAFVPPPEHSRNRHHFMTEKKTLSKFISKLSGQPDSYAEKQRYTFGRTLGAGSFGIVRYARDNETSEEVAVKIILKKALKGKEDMVLEEIELLSQLSEPHIVGFRNKFESKDKYYIVTQLATGGELFDRIIERGRFTEHDASIVVVQMLKALSYLHHKGIVHRDLKPENILYLDQRQDSPVVLADFGIAKRLASPEDLIYSSAGSFGYAAPEVIMGTGHGTACDIWSLGVITYSLLCGYSPFRSENVHDFINEVKHNNAVIFHADYWKDVSRDARRFIIKVLQFDPAKRPTADVLLNDPWLVSIAAQHASTDLLPNLKQGLDAKTKFKHAIEIVKLQNRIKKLKEMQTSDDDDPTEIGMFDQNGSVVPPKDNGDVTNEHSENAPTSEWSSLVEPMTKVSVKDDESKSKLSDIDSPYAKKKGGAATDAFVQLVQAAATNRERVKNYQENEKQ